MYGVRAAFLLILLVSCAPSRDAADVIAAHRSLERRIDAPPSRSPRPWSVGQWTLYKVSDGKHVGYIKHGVVATGACGLWIESTLVAGKYDDRFTIKTCFRDLEPGPLPDDLDAMQAVMTRQRQRTVMMDFRNGKNPRTKRLMQALISSFITVAWHSAPAQAEQEIVVPAGHFIGSKKIITRAWIEQSLHGTEVWVHDDVPLGGAIKVIGDDGSESVLLDYGLTGATSELPDFDQHLEDTGL